MWVASFLESVLRFSNLAVPLWAHLMVQSTILITAGLCAAYALMLSQRRH